MLCGYLYCIGDAFDAALLEKAKYGINMDVGCMIDAEWIESLRNDGKAEGWIPDRKTLTESFIRYYTNFTADDAEV